MLKSQNPKAFKDAADFDLDFADPSGRSALRAARKGNPRNRSCPNCRRPNVLTPADVARGYQCDACADAAEGGYGFPSYGDY